MIIDDFEQVVCTELRERYGPRIYGISLQKINRKNPRTGYLPPAEILQGNTLVEDIAFDINYENPLLVIAKNPEGADEGGSGIVDPVGKDTNFILKRDHSIFSAER